MNTYFKLVTIKSYTDTDVLFLSNLRLSSEKSNWNKTRANQVPKEKNTKC